MVLARAGPATIRFRPAAARSAAEPNHNALMCNLISKKAFLGLKLMFIESSPPGSWGSVRPFVRGELQRRDQTSSFRNFSDLPSWHWPEAQNRKGQRQVSGFHDHFSGIGSTSR